MTNPGDAIPGAHDADGAGRPAGSAYGRGRRRFPVIAAANVRAWPACMVMAGTVAISTMAGCVGAVPSQRFSSEVALPVPKAAASLPGPERLDVSLPGASLVITARSLIPVAFNLQPDIRSSFQRYRSEEARYDFFYSSLDSVSPRMRVSNDFGEARAEELVDRSRRHNVEVGVEKRFFDTTRMDVTAGIRNEGMNDNFGNAPFVAANVRYPLAASRERLERTSEDIFRQNELSDAQLGYIQEIRNRLQDALFRFHGVRDLYREVTFLESWAEDLQSLLDTTTASNAISDVQLRRLKAELSRVRSNVRIRTGRYEIDVARFKGACGIPFNTELEFRDDEFNPFIDYDHATLMALSIETDPEIATLRNSVQNAQVQLDLARRGTWDVALSVGAAGDMEGYGEAEGQSAWEAQVRVDVSHVDPRVTKSLSRQAQANISRFMQAIAARENTIFVDTLEPLVRIDTISQSQAELEASLPNFLKDYEDGIDLFMDEQISIDDLLQRRENLFNRQTEISDLRFLIGANVAELCSATGKFFELLQDDDVDVRGNPPLPVPESSS